MTSELSEPVAHTFELTHMQSTDKGLLLVKRFSEILLCLWILTFAGGVTKLGGFPIKTLLFLLFTLSAIYLLIRKDRIIVRHRIGLVVLFVWLAISANIAFFAGFDSSTLNQGTSLIATVLMVVLSFLLYENNSLSLETIKKSIYVSAGLGVAIKALLGLGVFLGFYSADAIDALMQNYMGSTSFNADEYGGFLGLLPRIGNAGDLFNLVVFLYYVKNNNGARVALAWVLMLIFVLVTYSRYLMLLFLIATFYSAGSNIRSRSKSAMVITTAILLALIIQYTEADIIYLEFEERFTGYTQSRSDSIREEMKDILINAFSDSPVFGIGLGGYVRNYLRSPTILWQYELEYLSLLMQFGIIGFILVVVNFTLYSVRMIISGHQKSYNIPTVISVLFWIGTPIQSSLFSGTQSALIIMSVFFLSRETRRNKILRHYRHRRIDSATAATARLEDVADYRVTSASAAPTRVKSQQWNSGLI